MLRRASGLVLIVCLAGLAMHVLYIQRVMPDAVYMDSLRLLDQLELWLAGKMSFYDFWSQHGAHRGFVNQLALWANVSFFSYDPLLANRATGVVIAIVAGIIGMAYLGDRSADGDRPDRITLAPAVCVAVVITALLYSGAGYELLTLDLGLPLWTKNLAVVAWLSAYARVVATDMAPVADGRPHTLAVVGLVVTAPLIVLVFTMGWSYAFAGGGLVGYGYALVSAWSRGSRAGTWRSLLPAVALLVSIGLYVATGGVIDSAASNLGAGSLASALLLVPYAWGAAWLNPWLAGTYGVPLVIAWFLGLATFILFVALALRLLRTLPGRVVSLALMLGGYGLLTGVAVSVARGGVGPEGAMASRYYMDVVMLPIGVIGLWWVTRQQQRGRRYWNAAGAVFIAGLLLSTAIVDRLEWKTAPYRALIFASMNDAVRLGIPDANAAARVPAPMGDARRGAAALWSHHLGVFAHTEGSSPACNAPALAGHGWYEGDNQGAWSADDATLEVAPCGCSLSFAAYVPGYFPERTVSVEVDGKPFASVLLEPGKGGAFTLPPGSQKRTLHLHLSAATVPHAEDPAQADMRSLGAHWDHPARICGAFSP
jgi:hypothetical protein